MATIEASRVPIADGSGYIDIDDDPVGLLPAHREMMLGAIEYTVTAIGAAVAPLLARIEALEKRTLAFRGVWSDAATPYPPASLVTHSGGMWHSNAVSSSRPGSDGTWTLIVKRGSV